MNRRILLLTAGLSPLLAAPALGQAGLTSILDDAARLENLRAIAVWADESEIAAQGYGGFSPDSPTNIKSASKSIISALAGIAIQRGDLDGPDQPIAPILRADLPDDPDPRLARVTLGNLLSMQAGLERQSGPNYGAWVSSRNWVRAALAAPFTQDPGGRMQYSTASTHLVSAILTRVTGRSTLDLARDWLDAVPGFAITGWERDPQGIYLGGNQMAMSTRSLLAFGALYANRGRAGGRQVVPETWIADSWRSRTSSIFSGQGYGYGWFVGEAGGRPVRYGWGYGGQMIFVFPATGRQPAAAVAMTSDPDQPSARTGYRNDLHRLADRIVRVV
ncbi:class C beta-lactamase-related serine hydrolase [Paracoccus sediminis]|uniref:Class C beta-lactamase-related serine hydrolase n=1 Tax=Paracoccus sediminis TaxID=1214787 RepID=A0A238X8N4_9RHOB|nr:serine hydrolase [Paracoccus sediminis]TBN49023.1 class C beta-lactamase-related serine hydrolase [Paracoccus sediminis]SNR54189.1 CubicO group peptidase, beta-lactamase class C family [Paracoccus sediminis]